MEDTNRVCRRVPSECGSVLCQGEHAQKSQCNMYEYGLKPQAIEECSGYELIRWKAFGVMELIYKSINILDLIRFRNDHKMIFIKFFRQKGPFLVQLHSVYLL